MKEDHNGFIDFGVRPISKVGIFDYLGSSIEAPDSNKIYKVLRTAEELGNKDTVNSFKSIPLINNHKMLGKHGVPAESKGVDGTTGDNVYFDGGVLYGNLKSFTDNLKENIGKGKKELSLGYTCDYDFTGGTFNGEHYDVIQKNIKGNHIALVDKGRMGKDVSVCDNSITFDSLEINFDLIKKEEEEMNEKDNKILEEVTEKLIALDSKIAQDEDQKKSMDDLQKENEDLKKQLADLKAENKKQKGEDAEELRVKITNEVKKELQAKDIMAKKIEEVAGTFDSAEMSLKEVISYGCDKFDIKAEAEEEKAMLSGFLHAQKSKKVEVIVAQDSKDAEFAPSMKHFK